MFCWCRSVLTLGDISTCNFNGECDESHWITIMSLLVPLASTKLILDQVFQPETSRFSELLPMNSTTSNIGCRPIVVRWCPILGWCQGDMTTGASLTSKVAKEAKVVTTGIRGEIDARTSFGLPQLVVSNIGLLYGVSWWLMMVNHG